MFEEPYIGMPIKLGGKHNIAHQRCCDNDLPLAMSYVPFQKWDSTYPLDKALERGTLFPELDLPFKGGMHR